MKLASGCLLVLMFLAICFKKYIDIKFYFLLPAYEHRSWTKGSFFLPKAVPQGNSVLKCRHDKINGKHKFPND